MCGIAGYVGNFKPELLKLMANTIAHRGPDAEGFWSDNICGLGHRRLSIIDPTDNASQPMQGVDERYVLTFNGEIYNFKELVAELEGYGYSFNKNSDTAVLAPLYDRYGPNMLKKLNGIFAFAIWDKHQKTLFTARDHMGVMPFYYTQTKEGFAFSSELKALAKIPSVNKDIDQDALFSYMTYLWCPGEPTLFKGVRKLLPGHYMMVDVEGGIDIQQYYQPPMPELDSKGQPIYDDTKTADDLRELFDDVVASQLLSDVPVGAFLSGGVDSSAIVSSMCQQKNAPKDVFCISFNDSSMVSEGFSEDIDYARMVANKYDLNLTEMTCDATCLDGLSDMVYSLDEPQADPAPLFVGLISKTASASGLKVLLSGTGGDDVFSGYRRHQAIMLADKLSIIPQSCRKIAATALQVMPSNKNLKRRLNKLAQIIGADLDDAIISAFNYTQPNTLSSLLTPDLKEAFANRVANHLEAELEKTASQSPLNRMLNTEWRGFLPDHNLNYSNKMGLAEGVEIRVPFVDPRVMEFAANLPPDQKLHGKETKYILKKAFEGRLPNELLYRSKAGFGAPIRTWLTDENHPLIQEFILSDTLQKRGLVDTNAVKKLFKDTQNRRVDGAYTLLSLIVIELWMRHFVDAGKDE